MCKNMSFVYKKSEKYEYELVEDFVFILPFELSYFKNEWIEINKNKITIFKGYCWNGCNYVPDFKGALEGSCIHDALYQFKTIPRILADLIFYIVMKFYKCKFSLLYLNGVRIFGSKYYNKC